MENNNTTHCPNMEDFETYLNKKGNDAFNKVFENHVTSCKLCNEAIDGYKQTGITKLGSYKKNHSQFSTQKNKLFWLKQFSYAATILLVIGISTFGLWFSKPEYNPLSENPVYEYLESPINNLFTNKKTLTKKSAEQYWYIGQADKLAVNDYLLDYNELESMMGNTKKTGSIHVQVENSNYEFSQLIILKLKENNEVPVYTYSNSKDIKKLTSWREF